MRSFLKFLVVICLIGAAGYGAYTKGIEYLKKRNRPEFKTADIVAGDIQVTVQASGKIKPVLSMQVGSFVSGPIIELLVDFNDEVEKDQVLARIDPRIYEANLLRDKATLATREADINRVTAELSRAINDEKRAIALRDENPKYISQAELDQRRFAREALEASLKIAKATVKQAQASVANSQLNLDYTFIRAPDAGIVLDRKIDPGQTLAAQFQTPELFVIAPDIRKKVHIYASVSEADMGLIQQAKEARKPVHFKLDAYRGEVFETGEIEQIRLSAQEEQNVVSYPVIVSTPNPDLRLLPGMTPNLTFHVSEKTDVIKVPKAALSFYPEKKEYVHEDDHDKLSLTGRGNRRAKQETENSDDEEEEIDGTKRHVWIKDGELLRAVELWTGISDMQYAEVLKGDLKPGDEVVTEVVKKTFGG